MTMNLKDMCDFIIELDCNVSLLRTEDVAILKAGRDLARDTLKEQEIPIEPETVVLLDSIINYLEIVGE